MNKRLLIESIIVSILLIIIGIGWRSLQGFILTKEYMPKITNDYDSITVLNSRTTFGIQSDNTLLLYILFFVSFTALYYGIRSLLRNQRND